MKIFENLSLQILNMEFVKRGFDLRLVGGCVRDHLLGLEPNDIDLCTDATPEEMMGMVSKSMSVIPTGIAHGTVTFAFPIHHDDGIPTYDMFEVTTLRIDTDTDGRHANVEFTRSFELDAARRDLTINAMSMDFAGNLYDYYGGSADLLDRVKIRFVGDAEQRIREDYLRILRYFRFAAKYDADMTPEDLSVIENNIGGLAGISKERIWSEMAKLFVSRGRVWAFKCLRSCNVDLAIGLPRTLPSSWHLLTADCPEAAVACFFASEPHKAEAFCQDWKMSGAETQKIVFLAYHKSVGITENDIQDFLVDGVPKNYVESLALLQDCTIERYMFIDRCPVPVFPVKGQDLLDAGHKPGREIGERLAVMRDRWVKSRYKLTKEDLLS